MNRTSCLLPRALRRTILTVLPAMIAAILLSACDGGKFKVNGTLEGEGLSDRTIVLEKSDFHGRWVAVDSTHTDSKGAFSLTRVAPASPEIFRIALGDEYIYLPVDSVETIEVKASTDGFARSFTVTGTTQAEALARFEKELIALPADADATTLDTFKRHAFTEYMSPWQGEILSYYVLTKTRGGKPIFDPADPSDVKYFAAVANGYKQNRPADPHTPLLEKIATDAMRERNSGKGIRRVIEADETQIIDITLPDENGREVSLSGITGGGTPTVLMFSLMNHPDSPELNREISNIYNSRHGDLKIYHVSLDPDQFEWREGARNLPWTTVYDAAGENSRTLVSYNVTTLPTFFIYDRSGNLTDRAESLADLRSKLSKY